MKNGPKAPKDPTKKKPMVYLILDDIVEGKPDERGGYSDNYFLDGRIAAKVKSIAPDISDDIARGLQFAPKFREMVDSIGITIMGQNEEDREAEVQFSLACKSTTGYDGSVLSTTLSCNGEEKIIAVADYPASDRDTSWNVIHTVYPKYMTPKMTVVFYLKDGYQVPEVTPDPPVDFESDRYRKMIQRSLISVGNTYRIQKAIEKARRGEDVTISYIGGSITQGAGAKPISTECYSYLSYQKFRERFAPGDGSNVHYLKAGVGGTCSELGLTRYNMDLLRYHTSEPDIVFVEYAVNDSGDETNGDCYESLVLKIMEGSSSPAVVLLFAVFMDDGNLQERLKPIGFNYNLPMISLKDAVTPQFYEEPPIMTKRQYFYDLFHPSNTGHRVMADCIDYFWEKASAAAKDEADVDLNVAPKVGNTYRNMEAFTRLDYDQYPAVKSLNCGSFTEKDTMLQCVEKDLNSHVLPEYPENWYYTGQNGHDSFQMEIECKDLMIVYKDEGNPTFGKAEVFIDGIKSREINPLEVGWTHCTAYIIHKGNKKEMHSVEVKLAPGDEDKKFTILGFGYTV